MNRVWYVINYPVCKHEILGVVFANNRLPIGEKIIPTDVKTGEPLTPLLDKIYGEGQRSVPTTILSNPGVIERFGFRKGEVDDTLKISCLDWKHTLFFLTAYKGV